MPDDNLKQAIHLLGVYTNKRYTIWDLAGSNKASCRSHIMSTLLGTKTPQSKSGVTALRTEFVKRTGVVGDCEATREDALIEYCKVLEA